MHTTTYILSESSTSMSSLHLLYIPRIECKNILHTNIELMNIKQLLQIVTTVLYNPE